MFIADVIIGGTRPYGYAFRVASRNDWVVDAVGASVGRRCVHRDGILRQRPLGTKGRRLNALVDGAILLTSASAPILP
jgi:hypothetical protein